MTNKTKKQAKNQDEKQETMRPVLTLTVCKERYVQDSESIQH